MSLSFENFESKQDLSFEKRDSDDLVLYIFKNIAVAIDTTERPMKELPEILFGNFKYDFSEKSLHQPDSRVEGVDMDYIANCIREVSRDSGINEFMFFPYGDDAPEHTKRRALARVKLFSRYFNVTPDPKGSGYILKL